MGQRTKAQRARETPTTFFDNRQIKRCFRCRPTTQRSQHSPNQRIKSMSFQPPMNIKVIYLTAASIAARGGRAGARGSKEGKAIRFVEVRGRSQRGDSGRVRIFRRI